MSEPERARLRGDVSHDRCVGVGMCTQLAPAAFRKNDVGLAEFDPNGDWTADDLYDAAEACPMSAIRVVPADDSAPGGEG